MQVRSVRQSGGPEPCDFCSSDTRPPDVIRQGATATRYLHPSCSEREALGAIVDANAARRLQGESGRRGDLRVVDA
jgi:hypothetical protein